MSVCARCTHVCQSIGLGLCATVFPFSSSTELNHVPTTQEEHSICCLVVAIQHAIALFSSHTAEIHFTPSTQNRMTFLKNKNAFDSIQSVFCPNVFLLFSFPFPPFVPKGKMLRGNLPAQFFLAEKRQIPDALGLPLGQISTTTVIITVTNWLHPRCGPQSCIDRSHLPAWESGAGYQGPQLFQGEGVARGRHRSCWQGTQTVRKR